MIDVLNDEKTEILKKEISKHFKPVKFLKCELSFEECAGNKEYFIRYFSSIQEKKPTYFIKNRRFLDINIEFFDGTAFFKKLPSNDYLGEIIERDSKIKDCLFNQFGSINVTNHITSYEKKYDLEKILKIILNSLGKAV